MQHRGEIVERAVRQSGMPLTQLTKKLGKSRRWIYTAFENPVLSIEVILEIGKVIHHDFSNDINELKNYRQLTTEAIELHYTAFDENTVEYWKNKYLILLEKYNTLLEGKK
jgi:hypothetical protein